jgi:DeoR/GlpR family transcriptional regulator of sugar metabolism
VLAAERRRAIANLIRRQSTVRLKELSETLQASDSTIRRDLEYLENEGLLERTYGGAVIAQEQADRSTKGVADLSPIADRIGAAAAERVNEGETIFVGAGPLSLAVARHIAHKQAITIITNALGVATHLTQSSSVPVILTGGQVERGSDTLVGHVAELALRELRADRAIIGVGGIQIPDGFTGDSLPEVQFVRAVIDMMPEVIVVAGPHKWGHVGPAYLAPLEAIDAIVTGTDAPPAMVWDLSQLGIEIIQV